MVQALENVPTTSPAVYVVIINIYQAVVPLNTFVNNAMLDKAGVSTSGAACRTLNEVEWTSEPLEPKEITPAAAITIALLVYAWCVITMAWPKVMPLSLATCKMVVD